MNCFTTYQPRVRWAPDAGVLAHLTNRVLPETPFWDELQQKECRSLSEFYKKESKFLKLENSKETLHKAYEATTSKKNDQGEKVEQKREMRSVELRRSRGKARRSHEVD